MREAFTNFLALLRPRTLLIFGKTAITLAACAGPTPEKPPVPEEQPPAVQGPRLMTGIGDHHHPIATASPEAQSYFDQGFALVFGFNHEEAVRSFQRAAELDPKAAMPLWGIAWAVGPNYNLDVDDERSRQAYSAMQKAVSLAQDGPAIERAYVEAMAIRFSPDPKADRAALARRYADRMRNLSRQFPDDLDAAMDAESLMNQNAWKLWALDGTPRKGPKRLSPCSSRSSSDPDASRRQPLLHPHRRGIAKSRRAPERRCPVRSRRRPVTYRTCRRTPTPDRRSPRASHANLAGIQADREH